jgi:simple sugar transport system substrate-binding protein/ribose transport system substrate-binding protein
MTKLPKNLFVLTIFLVVALLLAGCAGVPQPAPAEPQAEPETQSEEAAPAEEAEAEAPAETASSDEGFMLDPRIAEKVASGEPLMLRVSYHDVSNEFAPFIRRGTEQAAADFEIDVEMVGPVGPDADAQIAELENLVEAGVDGLAISSVSSDALAPIIDRLLAEGIPVVTYNTDNPESSRLAFAGQDLEQSGYEAAKVLADLINGEGDVIITTLDAAAQWSIDRETGARHHHPANGQHRYRTPGNL